MQLFRSLIASAVLLVGCSSIVSPGIAQSFADQADQLLTTYHDVGLLNGSVLVADGDSVLYEKGFGKADFAWDVPNTPTTKFRIASATKQFTAALMHQLAEQGLVELDAPITTYLPDYPVPQGDRVTAHHLLTHTSGIPNYTSLPGWDDMMRDPFVPDSFLTVFFDLDLRFEPGSQFQYSNSNYFVLGVIIEHVTNQPYAVALKERLLDPLGLHDTGYDTRKRVVEQKARGYVRVGGGYAPEGYIDVSLPYAAGMLYSTVQDLHRWKRALHSGAPFEQPETLKRMLTPHGAAQYGYAHGLGVNRRAFGPDTLLSIGHGGHIEGFNSDDRYFPDRNWTVIVLDNTNGNVGDVGNDLVRLLLDQTVEPPRKPISFVVMDLIAEKGIDAAVDEYLAMSRREPDAYNFEEGQLDRLGHTYLRRGDTDTAIRLFQVNVDQYPESANVLESLGEAYLIAGEPERAAAVYRRVLNIDSESADAQSALENLGAE